MADLILNVDFSPPWLRKKKEAGNLKHQTFLRRRRVLEQRGVLKQKQLPVAQPGGGSQKKPGPQGRRGKRPRATGGVLEKPNSIQPKPGPKANGHAAATRPPAATTRPPTAATRTPAAAKQTPTTASRTPTATKRTPAATSPAATSRTPKATNRPPAATTRPPAAVTGSSTAVTRPATAMQNSSTIPKGTNPKASACGKAKRNQKAPGLPPQPGKMVAIDCEMVGTGPGGRVSDLARCSIVNYHGDVMYDQYIRPTAPIVDYRTRWSGIRRQHMEIAIPFVRAQREILHILSGKIVIGHAIHNDFKALKYFHPKALTRDTSKIPLLNRKGGFPENVSISLKRLAKELLHQDIQVGKSGHSSVEDARATMELYKVVEAEWEQHLLLNPEQE